jgi:hypothetical protein
MAISAPSSCSFWAMAQAMLRLLASPKMTATRPCRLFAIVLCAPKIVGKGIHPVLRKDNSRKGLWGTRQLVAAAGQSAGITPGCEFHHGAEGKSCLLFDLL